MIPDGFSIILRYTDSNFAELRELHCSEKLQVSEYFRKKEGIQFES